MKTIKGEEQKDVRVRFIINTSIIGLSFVAHGAQKLFGFGGGGLKVFGEQFEKLGIKPGGTMALLAGLSELIGGAMFALGLLIKKPKLCKI